MPPDIRDLVAQALMRGFMPNPYLWDQMVSRGGIEAFQPAPGLPMQPVPNTPTPGPTAFNTLQQVGGGVLPAAKQAFGGLNTGSTGLDGLIGQATTFLGGAGSLYGLGSSIANKNVPGMIGGALSSGALAAKLLGNSGFAGSAGSALSGASPFLGGAGSLFSLINAARSGNVPGMIGSVPGLLSSASGIYGALSAPAASEVALGGAVEAGATGGAAAGGELAGLGALGGLGGALAPYIAAITLAMQDQAQQGPESRRAETLGIQRNFPGAWASLESAPAAAETVAAYDRVPGGGGVDLTTAIKNAQDAIYRTGDVSSYLGTRGGASKETPATDVSSFAQDFPRLESDALLAMLKGSQDIAKAGGTQPADTNVFMGPFANQFNGILDQPGQKLAPGALARPQFNANQALFQTAGYAGLPTPFVNDPTNVNNGQWYYQGLQDPSKPLMQGQAVGPMLPASGGGNPNGSEGGPPPDPVYSQEYTSIPQFNQNTQTTLAGTNPSNEFDNIIAMLKQANPDFDTSTLGKETASLSSTQFPGRAPSGMGGGTGIPGAPFLPSSGQLSADKQQLSSDPNALAVPLNASSGNTLDKALEASKAFLGSA